MPNSQSMDFRSEARAYQRDKKHNAKWAHGKTLKNGQGNTVAWHMNGAPETGLALRPSHGPAPKTRWEKSTMESAKVKAHRSIRNQIDDGPVFGRAEDWTSDNSGNEEVHDASAAPLPTDADLIYSYDTTSRPATGREVFSAALNQAVQRFENTETEKLISREYDVIDGVKEGYMADDDDDYEMVEHAHLN